MCLLLTIGCDNARPGKVGLVTNKNYRLVLGVILTPQVVENIFPSFESGAVHNGVDHDTCVRLVRGQRIFNLKQIIPRSIKFYILLVNQFYVDKLLFSSIRLYTL
jgi:hypothetical protein